MLQVSSNQYIDGGDRSNFVGRSGPVRAGTSIQLVEVFEQAAKRQVLEDDHGQAGQLTEGGADREHQEDLAQDRAAAQLWGKDYKIPAPLKTSKKWVKAKLRAVKKICKGYRWEMTHSTILQARPENVKDRRSGRWSASTTSTNPNQGPRHDTYHEKD